MGKGAVTGVTSKSDLCHSGKHRAEKELGPGEADTFQARSDELILVPLGPNLEEQEQIGDKGFHQAGV